MHRAEVKCWSEPISQHTHTHTQHIAPQISSNIFSLVSLLYIYINKNDYLHILPGRKYDFLEPFLFFGCFVPKRSNHLHFVWFCCKLFFVVAGFDFRSEKLVNSFRNFLRHLWRAQRESTLSFRQRYNSLVLPPPRNGSFKTMLVFDWCMLTVVQHPVKYSECNISTSRFEMCPERLNRIDKLESDELESI